MTLAVLLPGTGNALDPADAARLSGELSEALRAAGASSVESGPGALREAARQTQEQVLVCADNLVAHPSLLWMLATEPAGRTTALVIADPAGDLREERGKILPANGDGNVRYGGAICVAPADLPMLAAVADDDEKELLPALLRAGLMPVATPLRLLKADLVHDTAELTTARAQVAAVDEDKARLRMAVKEKDDFFTTYAVSTWSPLVTKLSARLGLTPSGVTAISVLFAVAAALAFWQASRPAMIVGGILLYLGFVLDCVDGQLARYTRRFGAFGGWLDTMADRAKEYAAYAGLAAGAERMGLDYAWPLAITAIVLQTVRHMTDAWYGALHDEAAAHPRPQAAGGVGARLSAASTRVQGDTGSVAYWLKRIVVFPIGERWALMAVLAIFFNGRVALAAMVVCGLFAAAYTLALRSLRALSMRVGVLDKVDTARFRDDGPLVRRLLSRANLPAPLAFAALAAVAALALVIALLIGWIEPHAKLAVVVVTVLVLAAGLSARARHDGPLDWLIPAALRAAELLTVLALGVAGGVPTAVTYLLIFALTLHHYDLVARMEKSAPEGRPRQNWLGWDGRVLLLVITLLLGVSDWGVAALAAVVIGSFLADAIADWRTGGARS
ncbi:DUF5941 domain-containing protein [Paractinoplanes brasiliensis]|uniref:CDP-alcohol phosphatidyltransferase-like enzyme n=1 Tax=Paractinoplanes brasiliensis TaxID=52695 RepID=A0A4V3C7V4_9ACTN|nr:DUF5941 domain-containing protein [Actinoplanes brasiliensis]TDO39108.1 CDP-alcohol phosphatidyltransferase-like enzyme [Actinoplanes brasiliensis]GID30191.1 hypothetical protein Abr02nite_51740 [Actinoplanes brasiliensis]